MTGNLATWSNQRGHASSEQSSHLSGEVSEDRGLFYGDGLFETILVVAGQAIWLDAHLARLQRGCSALAIAFPGNVRSEIERGLQASQLSDAVLKLVVTRQATARGYAMDASAGSNLYVLLYERPVQVAAVNVSIGLCATRLGIQPQLAGHKHLNRLEQVLARSEWQHPRVSEGLMLDTEGCLTEATASNLFLVHDKTLQTPLLDRCGVAGVMREWVLSMAPRLGFKVLKQRVVLADVEAADALLLTNSLMGVVAASHYIGPMVDLPEAGEVLTPQFSFDPQASGSVSRIFQHALAESRRRL